jgi:hypothetical protein
MGQDYEVTRLSKSILKKSLKKYHRGQMKDIPDEVYVFQKEMICNDARNERK